MRIGPKRPARFVALALVLGLPVGLAWGAAPPAREAQLFFSPG